MKNLLKISLVSLFGVATALAVAPRVAQVKEETMFQSVSGHHHVSRFIDPGVGEQYVTIDVNETKSVFLLEGEYEEYTFTATSTNGLYTVETLGDCITRLCVQMPDYSRIFDAGAEQGNNNAKVNFRATYNQQIKIYVYLEENPFGLHHAGIVQLRLRRQKFNAFTFESGIYNGDGVNSYSMTTTSHYTVPSEKFAVKFNCTNYVNEENLHVGGYWDPVGEKMQGEYVFFAGDAVPANLKFAYNSYMVGNISLEYVLNQTKLAFWSGSQTAKAVTGGSFASFSVQVGAECAIGFEKSVDTSRMKKFTDNFFTRFNDGYSVNECVAYAKNKFGFFETDVKSVKVFGNGNLTIYSTTVSNGAFTINDGFEQHEYFN